MTNANLMLTPNPSVTQFWARSWHSLFRKPFLTVGYWPVAGFFKSIGLSALGKIIGIYVVFALSAMMHHVALLSALNGLPPDHEPLSFISEYGGPIFFVRSNYFPHRFQIQSKKCD
jgi:hypothetical protein